MHAPNGGRHGQCSASIRRSMPRRRRRSPRQAAGACRASPPHCAGSSPPSRRRRSARRRRRLARLSLARAAAARSASRCWSCVWELVTMKSTAFPTPLATLAAGGQGLLATRSTARARTTRASAGTCCRRCSAWRIGFGLAALVGIPLGFMIGRFAFLTRMVQPAHQPAAAGVAAGLAADRPAGVQGAPTRPRSGRSSSARSGR